MFCLDIENIYIFSADKREVYDRYGKEGLSNNTGYFICTVFQISFRSHLSNFNEFLSLAWLRLSYYNESRVCST